MDPTSVAQLITLIILVLLSAFFSSAETAFTTVNKIRIRTFEEEGRPKAALIRKIIEEPQKMLSAILIGNNIVNLSASSLTTTMVTRIMMNLGLASKTATAIGISTGVLTLIILVFGEITPKSVSYTHLDVYKRQLPALVYWKASPVHRPVQIHQGHRIFYQSLS